MKEGRLFNLSIRERIIIVFGFIFLLYVLAAIYTYVQIGKVAELSEQTISHTNQIGLLQEFAISLELFDSSVEKFFTVGYTEYQEKAIGYLTEMQGTLARIETNDLQLLSVVEDSNNDLLQYTGELRYILTQLEQNIGTLTELSNNTLRSSNSNILIVAIFEQIEKIRNMHTQLTMYANVRIHNIVLTQKNLVANIITQLIVLGLAIFVIGTVLTFLFSRMLLGPITKLRNIAIKIGKGDFDIKANIETTDEFGQLAKTIEQMSADLKKKFELEKYSKDLEKEAVDRASELELNVVELEKTKIAIQNLLEDLSEGKKEVEKKVTERTKELSQEREKLDKIAQNMSVGAILLDKKGEVLFANTEARKIIGLQSQEEGLVLEKFFKKFKDSLVKESYERKLQGGDIKIPEAIAEGSIFEILFQGLSDDTKGTGEEEVFGHLIWIRDITEEKLLERSKSELIAVVSHQLRTPLTVTKGNTEMLLDEIFGKLNKEQRDIVFQTQESNEGLINLVNKMLDAAKVQTKKLNYDIVEVSLDKVIELAIKNLSTYAKNNNVTIKYTETEHKIPLILGDEEKLYEVFQNLIENAIKYTPSSKDGGLVNISISHTTNTIEVKISDRGIGIPTQEQENIFERFFRTKNAVKHVTNGTGLGLYIAKSIINYLKGTVRFESKVGVGTTFFVTFPILKK